MNPERLPLIAGNWKMNKGPAAAGEFAQALVHELSSIDDREVAVFPPFTAIPAVAARLRGSAIAWGAQNMHWEDSGAFTGEIAASFLVELGCRFVIVGHSERRTLFGESDTDCNRKILTALQAGLVPILCIGESLAEREAGTTSTVIEQQLAAGLAGVNPNAELVLAYEPVWAIGTGRTATPTQATAVHAQIRNWLRRQIADSLANRTRILYGGSVTPESIDALMATSEIDGVLVGGASLHIERFCRIVRFQS